jgi:hypothetical protein
LTSGESIQASKKLMAGQLGTVIEYHSTSQHQFPSISICPMEFKWVMLRESKENRLSRFRQFKYFDEKLSLLEMVLFKK